MAMKLMLSIAAESHDHVVLLADIARAYFAAAVTRKNAIEIPVAEEPNPELRRNMVAKLNKCLGGSRKEFTF